MVRSSRCVTAQEMSEELVELGTEVTCWPSSVLRVVVPPGPPLCGCGGHQERLKDSFSPQQGRFGSGPRGWVCRKAKQTPLETAQAEIHIRAPKCTA